MWGKLASEILVGNWEVAYEAVQELKESIDKAVRSQHVVVDPLNQFFTGVEIAT